VTIGDKRIFFDWDICHVKLLRGKVLSCELGEALTTGFCSNYELFSFLSKNLDLIGGRRVIDLELCTTGR
jgi:hypothetical protein